MAFIRRVRTGSGATAVQVAEYVGGRQRIVKHVGPAHTEVELGVLLEKARALLADPSQSVLGLAVTASPPVAALVEASGRSVLFETSGTARPGRGHGVTGCLLYTSRCV